MLRVNVVTLFPDWFTAPLASSILGRAKTAGLVQYRVVQLRDYTHDKHHTVDDAPYGGGAARSWITNRRRATRITRISWRRPAIRGRPAIAGSTSQTYC